MIVHLPVGRTENKPAAGCGAFSPNFFGKDYLFCLDTVLFDNVILWISSIANDIHSWPKLPQFWGVDDLRTRNYWIAPALRLCGL